VSILAVRQSQVDDESAKLIVTTHAARTASVKSAIEVIEKADYAKGVLQVMRVEGN